MSSLILNELKSRIVALNISKNDYASKKMKNDVSETDEKNLISTLIYVVAELRRCATDIGISDDGKINVELTQEIEQFNILNENVKDLKKQILFLTKSSPEEIKQEMINRIEENKQNEQKTNNNSRQEETRLRLQKHLQSLSSTKLS